MDNHLKVTIATFIGFTNRGAEALLRTRIASMRRYLPDVEFYVLTIYKDSCQPIEGVEYIQTFGGQREKLKSPTYLLKSSFLALLWSFDLLLYRLTGECILKDVRKISNSDAFISTDGDVLGEDYGLMPYIWRLYYLSIGLFLKKPVIIFAEGLGPFKSKFGRKISKIFFNKCTYISVRDEVSHEYLIDLGIKSKIDVVPDSAFLLEKADDKNLNYKEANRLLVGISVSELATKYGFKYGDEEDSYLGFIRFMSEVSSYIIDTYNADIIFVPHVIQIERDDHKTSEDICNLIKNYSHTRIADKNLDARQLKSIISYCDLMIASRMHASIAAISTGVPVIGIAYSHKMEGIFSMMDIKSVVNIKDLNWEFVKLIDVTIHDKEVIVKNILSKIDEIKVSAFIPAEAVKNILISN